jgi:hypothetical protein
VKRRNFWLGCPNRCSRPKQKKYDLRNDPRLRRFHSPHQHFFLPFTSNCFQEGALIWSSGCIVVSTPRRPNPCRPESDWVESKRATKLLTSRGPCIHTAINAKHSRGRDLILVENDEISPIMSQRRITRPKRWVSSFGLFSAGRHSVVTQGGGRRMARGLINRGFCDGKFHGAGIA